RCPPVLRTGMHERGFSRHCNAQVLVRVHRDIVDTDLIVKMRTGAASAEADVANNVAAVNLLPGDDGVTGQMAVKGGQPVPMFQDDGAPVTVHEVGVGDLAVRGSNNWLAILGADIHAAMERALTVKGIDAFAKRRRYPAHYRPQRGRSRGADPVIHG